MTAETAQETGAASMRWYTVHVYSSMEKSVQKAIIERISRSELKEFFGEVLLPVEKVEENRNGRKFATERRTRATCSSKW
jgi:transcriptional antiterminator NusG